MPKNDPKLLTQAAYARSRKARGLSGGSRQAVKKAVDEGRISAFGPDKLVDGELADRQWEKNTRARVAIGGPTEAGAADTPAPDLLTAPDTPPAAAPESGVLHQDQGYLKSRAAQADADARIAQLKAAELEGTLVRVDQVKAELASKLATVREGLLQLPARLAPALSAQSDAARIQTLLEAEIHQVLAPLSKMVAAAAVTTTNEEQHA